MQLTLEIWVGSKEIHGVQFRTGVNDLPTAMSRYIEQCFRDYPLRALQRDGAAIRAEAESLASRRTLGWRPTRQPVRCVVQLPELKVRALSRAVETQTLESELSSCIEWEFFAECLDSEARWYGETDG